MTLLETLSPRRREIIKLMADGLCVKEISARLGIAQATVSATTIQISKLLDLPNAERMTLVKHFYNFVEKSVSDD